MSDPLFSVIIPTYNHARSLGRAIRSLLEQTDKDWEAVIVNNFSQDDTEDVVKSFNDARLRLINFKNNGIIAASRNTGIRSARGQFLAFLDSDDWWYSEKLKTVHSLIHRYDLIYHTLHTYRGDEDRPCGRLSSWQVRVPVSEDILIRGFPIANSSVTVKKDLVEKAGLLDESPGLVTAEDSDLWIRIGRFSDRFRFIAAPLGGYHIGPSNMSADSRWVKAIDNLYSKHIDSLDGRIRTEALFRKEYIIGLKAMGAGRYDFAVEKFKIVSSSKVFELKIKSLIRRIQCNAKKS